MTLEAMGITVWLERDGTSPETKPLPRLVCVAQTAHSDEVLLHNILNAINCPLEDAQIIWVDRPHQLKNMTWPEVPTLVFGEDLYPFTPKTAIRTLALSALGQNIQAKKALWQSLKSLT